LKQHFRDEADCLLLPQSFDPQQRPWVATAFPSKWADYATLGLPVFVWAPPGSSSARFVDEHPGCAELVTSEDPAAVGAAIARLEGSETYRYGLALALLRVGAEIFSPRAAWQRFSDAITRPRQDVAA
jgi:hypothetical protein